MCLNYYYLIRKIVNLFIFIALKYYFKAIHFPFLCFINSHKFLYLFTLQFLSLVFNYKYFH